MRTNEFKVMLDNETSIKNWLGQIVNYGRKYNISLAVIGGEKMTFEKDGHKEIVNLKQGIDEVKNNLLSVKERFPIPTNNF